MFLEVEMDTSGTGWHIWLHAAWPPPTDGFDIWADDEEQVHDWVGPDNLAVEWLGMSSLRGGTEPPTHRLMRTHRKDRRQRRARPMLVFGVGVAILSTTTGWVQFGGAIITITGGAWEVAATVRHLRTRAVRRR